MFVKQTLKKVVSDDPRISNSDLISRLDKSIRSHIGLQFFSMWLCWSLRSWGHLRPVFQSLFYAKKNIFLVFCHLPICIISLLNAQKHVFGMYVFVYLVICVSKNQGLQWLTLSHYKCVQFSIFAVTSPHSQQSLVHTPNSHLTILPKVNCYQKSHSFNSILICFMFFPT